MLEDGELIMNRKGLASSIALLTLAAGLLYASPYITLFMIKRAIETKSATEIEKFIDFPDIRDSLRTQLADFLQEEASKDKEAPALAQLSAGIGSALGTTIIDALVKPGNLQKLLDGENVTDSDDSHSFPPLTDIIESRKPISFGYKSFDIFEVKLKDSQVVSSFDLERRNLFSWKVVGIGLNMNLISEQQNTRTAKETQSPARQSTFKDEPGISYVSGGPGDSFAVIRSGLLYWDSTEGLSSEPIGKPKHVSKNIIKVDGSYFCRWEGYADNIVPRDGQIWICTEEGIRTRN